MNPKTWHEFITSIWCRRATPTGLVACIICLTAGIWPVLKIMEKLNLPYLPWWLSLFLPLLAFPAWAWCRHLPVRINSAKSNIFLAPTCQSDCLEFVARLFRELNHEVRRRALAGKVRVHLLPTNHAVCNAEEAGVLLERLGGGVVVFGQYKKGNDVAKPMHGFNRIAFTLRAKRLLNIELSEAGRRALMEGRKFRVDESNSFRAEEEVAGHLTEVAVFLVGSSLLMSGEAEKSAELFEDLRKVPVSRSKAFTDTLRESVAISLLFAACSIYNRKLAGHVSDHSFDAAALECRRLLDRCLRADERKRRAWQALNAIISFHFGNVDASLEAWKQLAPVDPLGACLSLGFLYLWKKSEKDALAQYSSAPSYPYAEDTVKSVLTFLGGLIESAPDRTELLWALGFVNDHFFDQEMAIKDYKNFLAGRKSEFPLLAKYAQERLTGLDANKQDFIPGEKRMANLQAAQTIEDEKEKKIKAINRRKRKSKRKRKKRR